MKLSKKSIAVGGSVLLLMIALGATAFFAKKSGKIESQASTLTSYLTETNLHLNGKVVLQNGGSYDNVTVFLDVPTYALFNDEQYLTPYRELGVNVQPDGTFVLNNMPLGKKMIIVATNGVSSDDLMITTPTTPTTLDIGTFTLNNSTVPGSISLSALNSAGQPILNGSFQLIATNLGRDQSGTLDNSGKAVISNVLPGNYEILITDKENTNYSFDSKMSAFTVKPEENLTLDLRAK